MSDSDGSAERQDAKSGLARKGDSAGLKGIARKQLPFAILCTIAVILLETSGILRANKLIQEACPTLEIITWSK